jgi:hypothetical protein
MLYLAGRSREVGDKRLGFARVWTRVGGVVVWWCEVVRCGISVEERSGTGGIQLLVSTAVLIFSSAYRWGWQLQCRPALSIIIYLGTYFADFYTLFAWISSSIINLYSYRPKTQAAFSVMNLEPISNRQKREAGVLHGACRSCREFFGSAETRAVIKLGSYESVTYVRACRDLEISKEAGCVLCKTFVEIDAVRGVEGFRKWLRKGDSNYRLDERQYEICNYTGQSDLDDGYVVRGQWGEWDYTLEYTMQLLITTSAGMSNVIGLGPLLTYEK